MKNSGKYRRIVIKIGSNVLTRDDGHPTRRASRHLWTRLRACTVRAWRWSSSRRGPSLRDAACWSRAWGASTRSLRARLYSAVGQVKFAEPLLRPLQ